MENKKMTRKQAFDGLSLDILEKPSYEYFDAIKEASEYPDTIKKVVVDDAPNNEYWNNISENIISWVTKYVELNKGDRLSVSDLVIPKLTNNVLRGVFAITNGQNGITQVSRQSLKHVLDIITYLEDYYGARAYISSVFTRSDIFYYTISFVIWKDTLEESVKDNKYGNLRPLYHL